MQLSEQPTTEASCVQLGDLTIDLDGYLIHYPDGHERGLSLRERELLRVLIHARGRVLSYAALGLEAWHEPDQYYSLNSIRHCICRLRRKLGDSASIQAVRGVGYRLGRPRSSHSDAAQSSGRNMR